MNSVRVDMCNFDPETGMGTAKIVFADRNLKDSVKLVQEYTGRYAYLDDQSLQTLEFRKGACPTKHIPKDITCALGRAVRTKQSTYMPIVCVCLYINSFSCGCPWLRAYVFVLSQPQLCAICILLCPHGRGHSHLS